MNDFIKVFLNARSLRAVTKELSVVQLEDVLIKFTKIVEDRKESENAELEKQQEKQAMMNEILLQLKENGISPEELMNLTDSTTEKTKTKRGPRPAKYAYELNGETKTWTGQGRMPLPLQDVMNEKGSIEEFLI
ncbi:H-NS family nucleoid-associated regulatory protein [Moritella viscosa]|uniref:DNA-binding protein n=1 Tax=Moritella viscosa TaxID=80854 RepID=A0A090K9M0_9GAMM|nr:H-NS family nucleoid-associated regulatory protein [Moritella viscosa]CED60503.1 DNA binding protein H-NS [Moritella viscosa]SGY97348.1 DNA-binding protein H-NS [Moritella viscosa]SGZ03800.1 DNA-binding protein H-NS [Moritella viscosa]SGZ04257.1 DNA-binding protein H-NS [Moritella viscosa]SGZ10607.1 DNA-binding protein H-NS [Moritella viscosa]